MIIVGLGNLGEKFKNTRHNAGFMAIDFFAKQNDFPEFKLQKKYTSLTSEKNIEKKYPNSDGRQNQSIKIILVKPQTFMNEAGKAVASILKNKKEAELVVIHDDIDMPLGKIKFSKDSGAGGHKGVNSIINSLGKQDFIRLKIGICPATKKPEAVEKFVIEKFTKEELLVLNKVIETSANALKLLINEDLKKTMNEFN